MKFTARHARALAAGAATTAAYLAGAKLTDSRAIRGGGLLLLALTATAGAAQASAVAKTTKKRLDTHIAATAAAVHFINNGGTIGGAVTVSGSLSASSLSTGGGTISTSGGNITCGAITTSGQISMGGSLVMNNHDAFTFGHITANQIGPGSDRATLGSEPFTSAGLNNTVARCDYLLGQLEGAGICY